jgi:predicted transposase/invertase (TIGR01784 family)
LLYLSQYEPPNDWKAIAIFKDRAIAPKQLSKFQQEIVANNRLISIYLDELKDTQSAAIGIIGLITSPEQDAPKIVQNLKQQDLNADIIDLIETVLVSKFKNLSREEIETMFALSDLKNTKVYQEALQEGKEEGKREIELNLLKTGMKVTQVAQITGLAVEQVRQLQK